MLLFGKIDLASTRELYFNLSWQSPGVGGPNGLTAERLDEMCWGEIRWWHDRVNEQRHTEARQAEGKNVR